MDEWYYQRSGAAFGPLGARHLLAMRLRGSLNDETMVRRGQEGEWVAMSEAGLSEAVAELPPPPVRQPAAVLPPMPGAGPLVAEGPSRWLWFFGITAVILTAFHSLVLMMNACSFALGMLPPLELPDFVINFSQFCAEIMVPSSVLYFVSIIIWQGAAFASLARVYGENNVPHGSGSGFWWIAPVANLFMPFRCLRVMRHLSRRLREAPGAEPSPSLSVLGIQAAFITGTVMRVMHMASQPRRGSFPSGGESSSPFIAMMFDIALAAFVLQLCVFILMNLIQQVRLFQEARLRD